MERGPRAGHQNPEASLHPLPTTIFSLETIIDSSLPPWLVLSVSELCVNRIIRYELWLTVTSVRFTCAFVWGRSLHCYAFLPCWRTPQFTLFSVDGYFGDMNRAVVNIPTPDFCRAGPGVHRWTSLPWIRSRTFNPVKREGVVWAQTQVGW